MKYPQTVKDVYNNFESIKKVDENGEEYWDSDDLQGLLGYTKKQKFEGVIKKAIKAAETTGLSVEDQFTGAGKLVDIGSGCQREVPHYLVKRKAAYLIAQNGDSRKPEIGLAQTYFADSTIDNEQNLQMTEDAQRLINRIGYREEHKELSSIAIESGVHPRHLGQFHDAGQRALQGGHSVNDLKERKGLPATANYPDFMSSVELNSNKLRMSLTGQHLIENNIQGQKKAIDVHARVGQSVRNLISEYTNIMPEDMPAIESTCEVVNRAKLLSNDE